MKEPVLEVAGLVTGPGSPNTLFRLMLTDGTHYCVAVVDSTLWRFVKANMLSAGTLIQLTQYRIIIESKSSQRKGLRIDGLRILNTPHDSKGVALT
jgi:hypothetical protein